MLFGKHINKYYKKYWYYFISIFLVDGIVDFTQLLIPYFMGEAINKLVGGTFTMTTTDGTMSDFTFYLLAIALIGVIMVGGRIGWRMLSARIGAHVSYDMRKELFIHTQNLDLSFYKDKKVGGLLSYFTNDVETIKTLYSEGIIWLTDLVVLGVLAFVLMFIMAWKITLIAVIPMTLFIILGVVFGKGESTRYKAANDSFENLSDYSEESFQGFSVVKSYRKEQARLDSFRSLSRDTEVKNIGYQRYSSLINTFTNFIIDACYVILYFCICHAIISEDPSFAPNITQVGDMTTFVGYFGTIVWPMIAGGMLIDYISRGRGAYKRISSILDAEPEVVDKEDAYAPDEIKGEIKFDHLNFRYPDAEEGIYALKDISLKIEPGEMIGILGRTGSGKSTLVNLLPKLYNVDPGTLSIDGVDLNDWNQKKLKKMIGFVSQDSFLFSGTIAESVSFADPNPEIDKERVVSACRFACIDDEIERDFAEGYDTVLGEKGQTVSGGQRQRLSIARAVYKDPDLLIMDDSLSAVDASTEKEILDNIRRDRQGKTTIIVAHRISALERMDKIICMDGGKIIGFGTHDELYSSLKFYRDIADMQELEKEIV